MIGGISSIYTRSTLREQRLSSENASLAQDAQRLSNENDDLRAEQRRLRSENRDLQRQVDDLQQSAASGDRNQSARATERGSTIDVYA